MDGWDGWDGMGWDGMGWDGMEWMRTKINPTLAICERHKHISLTSLFTLFFRDFDFTNRFHNHTFRWI